jgi:integrase
MGASGTARHLECRPEIIAGAGDAVEAEFANDRWDAFVLGVCARRGRNTATFVKIEQGWLRESVKAWCRFRLGAGDSFNTIDATSQSMARFSRFLTGRPEVTDATGLTRELIESFLVWVATSGLSASTRASTLCFLKGFLEWGRRHATLPGLPAGAVIYEEEVTRPSDALPQFISEFVMTQLEDPAHLALLPSADVRHMVILLIETGIRGGDASVLPFNPIINDSTGWPCLRFDNSKVGVEQLIPLSAKAADTIRSQQHHVRDEWPDGSPWLFPGLLDNVDGSKPYDHGSLSGQLGRWQSKIDVRDEAGQPVRVHAHQFRHTVGTRLINAGVPQHVIQKLLGHASPRMTARYAQIHDSTVRTAFEAYCAQRVNTAGEPLPYDPDASTADAEWVKHNLSRIHDSLPNGYCGRPPQQDCPHPNACLTCPDFQTTPEFLGVHRQHAATNRKLIARADASGQFRLAGNLRRVQDSLDKIIPALEAVDSNNEFNT